MSKLSDTPGRHFCIAPFQSIRQNAYGRNSPCAFGAGEWHHGHLTPAERWDSLELNRLRQQFIDGEKPSECHRCWAEEDAGKVSLRQRQYEYFPNDYQDFILTGQWKQGPKTAVFKTSNVCNLACRSCGGWDTNTYTREGQEYAKLYNTQIDGKSHNRFIPLLPPKHMDFMQYRDIAGNLEKIDFFGGEPFLNITQLDLLEYLAEQGLSKKITLFYSTNCTTVATPRLKRAWDQFKRIEISMSIDGIGDQFEYLRWPGKWTTAVDVVHDILDLSNQIDAEVYTMVGYTVSNMNAYYVDQTYLWLKEQIGDVYINMVNSPDYLSLHIMPDHVKSSIRSVVKNPEVLGYLDIQSSNPLTWKQFIIWMKRQDLYRTQNFSTVFPEFFDIIKDDWNSTTDLSEENFYK
jgi:sulfatase maturation enzyme AslB (radical SAM superfamily)